MKSQINLRASLAHSLLIGAVLFSSCGFLNSISEITFGEGSLPLMEQQMTYPAVDDFVDLSSEDPLPGFPTSLNEGTLAHLVGALSVGGECGKTITQDDLGDAIKLAEFQLAACTEDQRCAELCDENFLGLTATTRLEVVIMTREQSIELQGQLSEESAGSIVQIRFQIRKLEFFQGKDEDRELTTSYIRDFQMWLGIPGVDPLLFLGTEDLNRIAIRAQEVETQLAQGVGGEPRFERYELPRDHPVTTTLINQILSGQEVVLSVTQHFKIHRDALYELKLSPAGVYQSLQPEVVINAIEAAASAL